MKKVLILVAILLGTTAMVNAQTGTTKTPQAKEVKAEKKAKKKAKAEKKAETLMPATAPVKKQ